MSPIGGLPKGSAPSGLFAPPPHLFRKNVEGLEKKIRGGPPLKVAA